MRFDLKMLLPLSLMALVLGACSEKNARVTTTLNHDAALKGDLPTNPLKWRVITSGFDKRDGTMSTLFGNDIAVDWARNHAGHDYPGGSVIALVTWKQQEDPRWFGGNIPREVKSAEFVSINGSSYAYRDFEGTPLKELTGQQPDERAKYLMSQRAAVMP